MFISSAVRMTYGLSPTRIVSRCDKLAEEDVHKDGVATVDVCQIHAIPEVNMKQRDNIPCAMTFNVTGFQRIESCSLVYGPDQVLLCQAIRHRNTWRFTILTRASASNDSSNCVTVSYSIR